ncbi:hypothetical protein Tco_0130700 [Tanacetum coccineum]
MVYVVNDVLASGVDMVLEKDFAGFTLQEMEIHPLMLLIRTLSMILQTFSPTLHNPSTNHTCVNYVETMLIMVMIVLEHEPGYDNFYPQNSPILTNPRSIPSIINLSIQEDLNQQRMNDVLKAVQSLVEKLCQQEQATNLSTHTPEPS